MTMCLKHQDRPATAKCTTCFKPLCDECAIVAGRNKFCSMPCQQSFAAAAERLGAMANRDRARTRWKLIKWGVILLVLVLAAVAADKYLEKNPGIFKQLMSKAKFLQKKVQKETSGLGSTMFVEGKVKRIVTDYAAAIQSGQWDKAIAYCAANMTWTYQSENMSYMVQGSNAIQGFIDSIRKIENRDGFNVEITSCKIGGGKAMVEGNIRIPICYDRIQMNFGKLVVHAAFVLNQQADNWKIINIVEMSQRQKE